MKTLHDDVRPCPLPVPMRPPVFPTVLLLLQVVGLEREAGWGQGAACCVPGN